MCMPELTGQNKVSFDANGRLKLPNKLIEAMPQEQKDKLVATRGIQHCISLYTLPDWDKYKQSINMIQGLSVIEKLNLQRKIIGISTELTMDKQGRITLPANLIEFGKLEGCNEVTVIGIEHVIEIWNPEVFKLVDEDNEQMALDALNRRPTF